MMLIALGIFLILSAVAMVWRMDLDNLSSLSLADFFLAQRAGVTLLLGCLSALIGAAMIAGR